MTWRVLVLGTALAALTLAFGAAASAEDEEGEEENVGYNRLGGYLQVAGVYSWEDFSGGLTGSPVGGFSLRTGNRFHRNFSVEFQYEFLANREVRMIASPTDTLLGEVYSHHITLNFRSYPFPGLLNGPLLGRVQPFVIGGFGAGVYDTRDGDDVGFVARGGGGLDVYATDNIVFSLEAVYALSAGGQGGGAELAGDDVLDLKDLNHLSVSLGAAYRF
jgi:hypothetical protein